VESITAARDLAGTPLARAVGLLTRYVTVTQISRPAALDGCEGGDIGDVAEVLEVIAGELLARRPDGGAPFLQHLGLMAAEREAVQAAERGYGPQPGQDERIAAGQLTALAASGDLAAARQLVHELEHGISPFTVDPWRLLDAIAGQLRLPVPTGSNAPPGCEGTA
jgi:hypothetical protein